MTERKQIINTAVAAAHAATEKLMPRWLECRDQKGSIMDHHRKDDLSPVTKVDREVEALIRDIVLSNHPHHRILGEEGGVSGDTHSPYLWVVDPIDGTKKYIRGLPEFAVLIAVFCGEQVIVGVSHAPALNETIVASRNGGAFLNDRRQLHVSSIRKISEVFLTHGENRLFSQTGHLTNLVTLCDDVWGTKGFEDFLSYHLVAGGRIDAVLESKTNIWDIAAVSLIVEEAGGKVTDLYGNPLSVNSSSVIATNGLVHDRIVSYLRESSDIST